MLRQALKRKTLLERAAFLDGACGGDAALRVEVEVLLASQGSGVKGPRPRSVLPAARLPQELFHFMTSSI